MESSAEAFDRKAAIYDLLIDWDRRLANEAPFYRQLFERAKVRRVLDAACGTGRHAAMFHEWGLEVQGADLSTGMIAECRARVGERAGLTWAVRSFDEPVEPGSFDAVICVGNSLALVGDQAAVERSLANLLAAVAPGGVCVVQVLNLWSVPESRTIWQKCRRVSHAGGDHILLKALRRIGDRGHIDLVDLRLEGTAVSPHYDAAEFLGLQAAALVAVARACGVLHADVLGSFQRDPYDSAKSTDLILVFNK